MKFCCSQICHTNFPLQPPPQTQCMQFGVEERPAPQSLLARRGREKLLEPKRQQDLNRGCVGRSRHTMQAWVEINSCSATCLFGFRLCQEWPCSRWFALDQPRLTVNSQKYPRVARISSIKRKTLNCWQLGIICISANTSVSSIPSEANLQVHNYWVAAGTVWRMSIWARDPSRQAIPDVLSIGMDLFDDLQVGIVAFVNHAE